MCGLRVVTEDIGGRADEENPLFSASGNPWKEKQENQNYHDGWSATKWQYGAEQRMKTSDETILIVDDKPQAISDRKFSLFNN